MNARGCTALLLLAGSVAVYCAVTSGAEAQTWCNSAPSNPAGNSNISFSDWNSTNEQTAIAALQQQDTTDTNSTTVNLVPQSYYNLSSDSKLLYLINRERVLRNLQPFDSGDLRVGMQGLGYGNDLTLSTAADHHSQFLITSKMPARIPGESVSPWHSNGVEDTMQSRLSAIPGVGTHTAGEIVAGGQNPASAVFNWMYMDLNNHWQHRDAILGFNGTGDCYTNAGTGSAGGSQYGSMFTVEFVASTASGQTHTPRVLGNKKFIINEAGGLDSSVV